MGQSLWAQRTTVVNNETWWGLITATRVSEKWSWWNDFHFVNNLFFIGRTGATYHSKGNKFVTTVGYAYLKLGAPFSEGSLVRPEHRPWMQTVYRVPGKGKLTTSFRFRYDARFIANLSDTAVEQGYSFNHRWRFNNALRYNWGNVLHKKIGLSTNFLNESLITTGPGPNGVPFEHRTHLMLAFSQKSVTLQTGYIVRFLKVNPSLTRINHGPVIWLSVNLRPAFLHHKEKIVHADDQSE
jgi:hypothetical protein